MLRIKILDEESNCLITTVQAQQYTCGLSQMSELPPWLRDKPQRNSAQQ